MQVVIGVDPGAANLGFGFVRVEGNRMSALDAGVVETSADLPIERRLEHIHAELAKLIAWHEPTALAIEDSTSARTSARRWPSGRRAESRCSPPRSAASPAPPTRRRRSRWPSAAAGSAGKQQVQRMVGTLLGLPEPPASDHAADALAVAICHGAGAGRRAAVEAADARG